MGMRRVASERQSRVLVRVEFGDVDINEPNCWILKRCFLGSAREVTVTRSDSNDQIGFASCDICAGCASRS